MEFTSFILTDKIIEELKRSHQNLLVYERVSASSMKALNVIEL